MAKTVLMRCRDGDMLGPVCDYFTDDESLDEVAREMRVHAKTHNEPDISDDDVNELRRILAEKEERISM